MAELPYYADLNDLILGTNKHTESVEQRFVPTFVGNRDINYLVRSVIWRQHLSKNKTHCRHCGHGGTNLIVAKVHHSDVKMEYYTFIDFWTCCLTYDNCFINYISNNFNDLYYLAMTDQQREIYSYSLVKTAVYDVNLKDYYPNFIKNKINFISKGLPIDLVNIVLSYYLPNVKITKPNLLG